MSPHQFVARKQLRRPAGCEGHLTRRQAAALLGFASEYKIREFEREGLLRSVRGPMRTAFYARPELLALKARLLETEGPAPDDWTDADLLALLALPAKSGRPRSALDLVAETHISIDRAERVYRFGTNGTEPSEVAPVEPAPHPPSPARRPLSPGHFGSTTPAPHPLSSAQRPLPAPRGEAGSHERRGEDRLAHDGLIRNLRDPDPRVRQQAFECLRERRSASGG